jgi:ABC-type transport system substrate-binding protein
MVEVPKVLHVGTLTPVSNLDPRRAHDFTGHLVLSQVFESPMRRVAGEFESVLLDGPLEARTTGTARIYTARVLADAKFSDGSPVLPEHIVDAVREATRPDVLEAEVVGDAVELRPSDAGLRPEDILAHRTCAVVRMNEDEALGTGPFRILSIGEDTVRLVRNPHARRVAGVDGVEVRCHQPSSGGRPESLLAGIASGSVDFTLSLSRDDVVGLSGVRKVFQAGMSTAILSMNTERPHFAALETRRAVARAIDRYRLAELCYANPGAFVARCLLPPGLGRGNDRLRHDPVSAKEWLTKHPLPSALKMIQVWGPRPYLSRHKEVADAIGDQLSSLGTRLEVQVAEDSVDYFRLLRTGDYDLVLGGWVADTPDAVDYLESTVGAVNIPVPDVSPATTCNYARWRDDETDRLLVRARQGSNTQSAIDAILERVADQVPLIPLMYGPRVFVHAWRVRGFSPDESVMPDLASVTLDD